MGCGEGCVSSSRHPLGAVCCNSEGRGCSHVPRSSKIVWKTRRESPSQECDPNRSSARRGSSLETRPLDNVSLIQPIVSVSALMLGPRGCALPWTIISQLHAAEASFWHHIEEIRSNGFSPLIPQLLLSELIIEAGKGQECTSEK